MRYSKPVSLENRINIQSQGRYEVWANMPLAQEDIYKITGALCIYLYENDIKNLLLVDSSARPAWMAVTTYWRRHYADAPRPDIYFVNPVGIRPSASEVKGHVVPTADASLAVLKGYYPMDEIMCVRTEQEIVEEFPRTYSQLMKHKQCRTLVFDVCMHSGKTMKPILHMLGRLGFADVRTGIANNYRNRYTYGIEPDIVAHPGLPYHPCAVFAHENAVDKTFARSVSLRNEDISTEDKEWMREVRSEIKQIIEQYSELEQCTNT